MEKVLIQGYPCLLGDVKLKENTFFSLNPGDVVSCFGDGRKNGGYTTLGFNPPLTYRGSIDLDNTLFFAFEVHPDGIAGFNLFKPEQSVYVCFQECSGMVALMSNNTNKLLLMHPQFLTNKQ